MMLRFYCYENVYLSADRPGAEIYWGPTEVVPLSWNGGVIGYAAHPCYHADGLYCSVVSDQDIENGWIIAVMKVLAKNENGEPTAIEIMGFEVQVTMPYTKRPIRPIHKPEIITFKL